MEMRHDLWLVPAWYSKVPPYFAERHVFESRKSFQGSRRDLDETSKTKVFLNDDIIDCSHDESNLGGIGGASEVGVDLLGLVLV